MEGLHSADQILLFNKNHTGIALYQTAATLFLGMVWIIFKNFNIFHLFLYPKGSLLSYLVK